MAEVKVEIGAEIKDFQSKLAQALKGFDKLKAKEKELSKAFKEGKISSEKYYSSLAKNSIKLKQSASNVAKYKLGLDNTTKGFGKLQKGAANGSSAMTAFSRTVQDAPFGLMGVSNNITNLTEQFGYLKKRSGSAGGALKLMLKDLKGFGGITLAISLATSLMLVFGDKILKTKDKTKSLREEQEKLTKSLDDYVFGLEAVAQAKIKGQQKAQKELFTLRILKETIENTAKSDGVRKAALDKLRKIYPSYLQNLTDEKALGGGLKTVYDELTTSILKRAKATAASNLIIKNSETLLGLESKNSALKDEIANKEIKYGKITLKNGKRVTNLKGKEAIAYAKINPLLEKQKELLGQIQTLQLTNIDLEQGIDVSLGIVPTVTVTDEEKNRFAKKIGDAFPDTIGTTAISFPAIPILGLTLNQFEKDAIALKIKLAEFNTQVSELMNQTKEQGIIGFASSIGNAMANGGNAIQAGGAALLGILGGVMVKYGKLIIKFGLAKEALSKSLKNPFGGGIGAVVAGAALVAIGSAIKGFSANVANSGGSSGGSSNASSGGGSSSFSGGSSSSFGSSGGNGGGTVVFEIAGTKLVGVLSNTLKRNRNLGGTISLN